MSRASVLSILAATLLLFPDRLLAGGPPLLCVPLDGVSAKTAENCTELLKARLANKLIEYPGRVREVKVLERANQWYLVFYMGSDVRLSDVTAALAGSEFSVPLSKLRLFGHVILEIECPTASRQALLSDLEALNYASVAESKTEKEFFLVTLDMPYPIDNGRNDPESVGWDAFQWNDFASNPSAKSERPATSQKLPKYDEIRELAAKHQAELKGVCWSTLYACRPLGCVTEPKSAAVPARATPR